MPLFSPTAIATLRGINRAALTSLATIERATRAASTGGANTGVQSWAAITDGTAVPCRLAILAAPSTILTQAGQPIAPDRIHVVFDVAGPDVKTGDRITVTGKDAAGADWSRVVVVRSSRNPRTNSAMRVYVCDDAGPGRT